MNVSPVDTDVNGVIAPNVEAARPQVPGRDSSLADWWFAALDQRCVRVGNELWTTKVVGVHVHNLSVWIQLEFAEGPSRSLLLCLQPGAGVHEAVGVIDAMIRRVERW